uniref:Protein MAIN-LIKE 1-like n=1 Tax=Cicer arietinum TaxID=3827 RepID=A0A1S2XG71_CICAR|nr:protein MAIN-LIKE 1-like [Cicer arietinum]
MWIPADVDFVASLAYAVSVAYLECFRDLNSCGRYAWGATTLAYLYDNLREANIHQIRTVSGYMTLLQVWVYEYFPTLCRDCCRLSLSYVEDYTRALKWKPKRDKGLVLPFRKSLDEIDVDEVYWTLYEEHLVKRPFEEVSLFRWWIRWGSKMYAHLPDKVLRQYDHVQTIHGSPLEFHIISHPYNIRKEPIHEEPVAHAADVEPTDHADEDATHVADGVDLAVDVKVY